MNRIKELRKQKELSLAKLSEQLKSNYDLKISAPSLMRYENEKTEPKLETWQKLAEFFDVPVWYLQGTENNLSEDEFENAMDEFARQSINKRERDTAYSLVELVQKFADKELAPTQTKLLTLLVPIINSDNDEFLISLGRAFSSLELSCSEDFIGEDGHLEPDQTQMIVDDFKEALEAIYIPEYDYKK